MASPEHQALVEILRSQPVLDGATISDMRAGMEDMAAGAPIPQGSVVKQVDAGGVPAEWVSHNGAGDGVVLYLHGGGYCIGSPASYRGLTSALAAASGLAVHVPDYRLAPEQPCPAALEDARAVYAGLARQSRAVVLAGDSAGGGLALALAQALRAGGERAPAALLLISPWVDLNCSSATFAERAARDPLLSPGGLRRWAACYAGARGVSDPVCSPLHGEAGGLPPVLIQVGSEEVLLDDSRRLHARIEAAGGRATLRVFEGLWHDFQLHAGLLADADAAIAELGAFARAHAPT
jgi:monoterpene epsilon-lactone hydrolase